MSRKIQSNKAVNILKLIGKPAFFLFTLLSIIVFVYFYLLKLFVQTIPRFIKPPHLRLPKLPKIDIRFKFNSLSIIIFLLLLLSSYCFYYFILKDLPSPTLLTTNTPVLSTKILDRNGNLLYQIYKDENRTLISLSDLPPKLIQATLAAEDKNFYKHHGVDISGTLRALYHNLSCYINSSSCGPLEGGSTITQQLIKNTLLSSEKTLTRKLKEAILALYTERLYDKDTILEMYFNQVPYGGTAYGIEQAAREYFDKSAPELNLAESAFLAGLPVSPTVLSPYGTYPYLSKLRQQEVLERMVSLGMISEEEKLNASSFPLNLKGSKKTILAPHFVMYIRSLLVEKFGESTVNQGGLTVTTSLDLSLNNILQDSISTELFKLKNLNVTNAAGIILDPQTGEILGMVGSHDFFDTQHDGQVNVTLMPRQPGSSIKPLTYTLAFMHGLSPTSTIDDSPVCFKQIGSPDYCPKNYDGKFHGKVTLKTALASSYNVPAIKLLNSLGVNNLIELAHSMGITTWNDPSRFGLALTLGGGEVTMLDLAHAYSIFATNGVSHNLKPILSVKDNSGKELLSPVDYSEQIIPSAVAFQINQTLSDNSARAPAFGYNSVLNIKDHKVAVKTGTTNNLRDNWTIGYTPNYLVATWVGNNNNSPMSNVASGITGASPIWNRTISAILKQNNSSTFEIPATIVKAKSSCNPQSYDYFIKGQEPKLNCNAPQSGEVL